MDHSLMVVVSIFSVTIGGWGLAPEPGPQCYAKYPTHMTVKA
ncbi:hypothetical protein [Corynebacterium aurimucosum]|nr:hypothetical protein [Corynebacterium aurimucosum]